MVCKVCGMDSKTAGTCSWCGASLNPPPEPTVSAKPTRREPLELEEPQSELAAVETAAPEAAISELPASMQSRPSLDAYPTLEALRPTAAPAPPTPARESPGPVHVHSARKMAPPTPPPASRSHKPAPAAAPPPSKRVGSPLLSPSAPSAPASKLPAPTLLPEGSPATSSPVAHAPVASLQEMADSMVAPPVLETANAAEAALPAPTIAAAPPAHSLLTPSLADATLSEPAIGAGVVPPKASALPASTPSIAPSIVTERNKRAAVAAVMAEAGPSASTLLGRYLGVFAAIALAMTLLAYFLPRFYIAPMLIAMFVAALLLPVMRVTPWVEDDAEDLALFVVLTLLFGPLVALIIYGVIAAFRQSFNVSILGCLIVAALLRIMAELASGGVGSVGQLFTITSPFSGLQQISKDIFLLLLRNWSGFAALAGWYAASSFHKEDE